MFMPCDMNSDNIIISKFRSSRCSTALFKYNRYNNHVSIKIITSEYCNGWETEAGSRKGLMREKAFQLATS